MRKAQRTKLLDRSYNTRDAQLFIIATEGAKTEESYFRIFQDSRIKIEVLPTGMANDSAPQHVIDRLNEFSQKYDLGENDLDPSDTTCKDFKTRLRTILGSYNSSNLDISPFLEHIQAAIQRAKQLHPNANQNWPPTPGSHVYRVVEMLLKATRTS